MQKKKRDWAKLSARLASLASELKNSPPPPPRRRKRRSPSKIPKYNPQKQQHPQHPHHHHQRTTPRQHRTTNNATSSTNPKTPSQQGTSRLSQVREKSIRSKLRAAAYTIGGINWYKLFKHYDRDNSGALDYDEFRRAVRRDAKLTVSQLPDSDLRWLFRQIDVDGGGSVEIEEFTNYLEEKKKDGNVSSTVKKNSTATSTRRQRKRKEGNYGTTSTPPPSRIPRSDYGRKNHTNTHPSKLQYQNRSSSSTTTTGTGGTSIRRRRGGNEEKKSKKERTSTHVSQNSVASSRRHQMTPVREKEIRSRLRVVSHNIGGLNWSKLFKKFE